MSFSTGWLSPFTSFTSRIRPIREPAVDVETNIVNAEIIPVAAFCPYTQATKTQADGYSLGIVNRQQSGVGPEIIPFLFGLLGMRERAAVKHQHHASPGNRGEGAYTHQTKRRKLYVITRLPMQRHAPRTRLYEIPNLINQIFIRLHSSPKKNRATGFFYPNRLFEQFVLSHVTD